jgi:hypothetical protein
MMTSRTTASAAAEAYWIRRVSRPLLELYKLDAIRAGSAAAGPGFALTRF